MKKFSGFYIVFLLLFYVSFANAYPSFVPFCDVNADYSNIGMERPKFQNGGVYALTANSEFYLFGDFLEITISGPEFTGLVLEVENAAGTRIGEFDFMNEPGIQNCDGGVMHTSDHNDQTSRTLFWVPPAGVYEDMYVQAYVLKGTRGNTSAQEFYRFARSETGVSNALLLKSDVIFTSDLE